MRNLALGLMSGTSADGVSLAVCEFSNVGARSPRPGGVTPPLLLVYKTFAYPRVLQKKIRLGSQLTAKQLSQLNFELGHFFATCILNCTTGGAIHLSEIKVIGSHGQTIYHGNQDKPKNTLQIGEAAVIAERTGIPVVSDFRTADIAAGGEGAPLIPFFDQTFYGQGKPVALQNIGGISNVTVVGREVKPLAFDNGPGNCLIDAAIRRLSKGKKAFDKNGDFAAKGKIQYSLVKDLCRYSYFKKRPPKSTGLEAFNESFLPKTFFRMKPEDQIATLTFFTAAAIYESYRRFIPQTVSEIIVSGGGALNQTLMKHLKELFNPIPVKSIEETGIPAQAKEPAAFAFFALRAIQGQINHLPSVTGAKSACVLGKISLPSRDESKLSFPRKRESIARWIPASAGMTE